MPTPATPMPGSNTRTRLLRRPATRDPGLRRLPAAGHDDVIRYDAGVLPLEMGAGAARIPSLRTLASPTPHVDLREAPVVVIHYARLWKTNLPYG